MRSAIALLVLLAACDPPPPSECGTGGGSVEVGRGGSRLRSLPATGGELDIVRGSQGGIHVVVGAWVEGMDLEMTMTYRLEEDGEVIGTPTSVPLRDALFVPAGTRWVRHPDLVVLDNLSPSVERFAGHTVDLTVEAVSVDGSHACDTRSVTLTDPGP
ncbi:MAG: hypothetical protein R3B82_26250 [Sandaracinaceae bacterium]